MGCTTSRDRMELNSSLSTVLLAAKGNGITILDGVHLNINDQEGFEVSCRQSSNMGFDGKTLIHPKVYKKRESLQSMSFPFFRPLNMQIKPLHQVKKK